MWLCHDENQKDKISHEELQDRKRRAQSLSENYEESSNPVVSKGAQKA